MEIPGAIKRREKAAERRKRRRERDLGKRTRGREEGLAAVRQRFRCPEV